MSILDGFTADQIAQLAPQRGLSVGTKGMAMKLERRGFKVNKTKDGWTCEHEGRTLVCSDSTLFLEEI